MATIGNIIELATLKTECNFPTKPEGPIIRSVRRLTRLGDLCLETHTSSGAAWLAHPDIVDFLRAKLAANLAVKKRMYSVIAEFVPAHYTIESDVFLRETEISNQIPKDSIKSAKWIKPPGCREQGQQSAFAVFSFDSKEIANSILQKPLVLNCDGYRVKFK